jgi:hypothetical protein
MSEKMTSQNKLSEFKSVPYQTPLTLSFPRSQKGFVIDKRLVNLLVKSARQKSYTAHLQ